VRQGDDLCYQQPNALDAAVPPVYTSIRPYSQTRGNTQRDLGFPDEGLRLGRERCIAPFQGHKPALLYKLAPEQLPDYNKLKSCRIIDYTPERKRREEEQAKKSTPTLSPSALSAIPKPKTGTESTPPPPEPAPAPEPYPADDLSYNISDMNEAAGGGLGMVEATDVRDMDLDDGEDNPPGW